MHYLTLPKHLLVCDCSADKHSEVIQVHEHERLVVASKLSDDSSTAHQRKQKMVSAGQLNKIYYYYVAEMTDQNKHVCENMSKGKCLRLAACMTGFVG